MSSSSISSVRVAASLLATAAFGLSVATAQAASLNEGFDSVVPSGWTMVNNSQTPNPASGWFQGDPSAASSFPAQQGAANSYAAANFNATMNVNSDGLRIGHISTWLITPTLTFNNGDVLSFWTRTTGQGLFADRMQVRFSNVGGTSVGSDDTSVGTFTQQLFSINPNLNLTDYPTTWTQYSYTFSGLAGPTNGAIGFRYYVTEGGPDSFDYSDYIGLDSVTVTPVPEPSAYALALAGVLIVGGISRRRRELNLDN